MSCWDLLRTVAPMVRTGNVEQATWRRSDSQTRMFLRAPREPAFSTDGSTWEAGVEQETHGTAESPALAHEPVR